MYSAVYVSRLSLSSVDFCGQRGCVHARQCRKIHEIVQPWFDKYMKSPTEATPNFKDQVTAVEPGLAGLSPQRGVSKALDC